MSGMCRYGACPIAVPPSFPLKNLIKYLPWWLASCKIHDKWRFNRHNLYIIIVGCEIVDTDSHGIIISPGYNVLQYPTLTTCSWTISTPKGEPALLRFPNSETFDLPGSESLLQVNFYLFLYYLPNAFNS